MSSSEARLALVVGLPLVLAGAPRQSTGRGQRALSSTTSSALIKA